MSEATIKHSVMIDGRKTSVSLELPWWRELRRIAGELEYRSCHALIVEIDRNRRQAAKRRCAGLGNLSNAVRLFVFGDVIARANGTAAPATAASQPEFLQ